MLSYRHSFHAGNHADVLKHTVESLIIESLKEKDKPFLYLDTHAGAGRYQIGSGHAERTGEYLEGIARIWQQDDLPAELEAYLDVKVENGNLVLGLNNTSQKIISLFKDQDWKIKAKVSCPDMERINLSGAAKLTMLDEFRVSSLDIKVSGASSLDRALFKGDGNISLIASGASHAELELSGNYSSAEIRCSGASNLYVSGGKYDRCYIDASGASDMEMENVGFADVSVELSGASKLLLSGSADFLNVDAGGASSCKAASLVADRARVEASGASSVTVNAKSMDYTDISRSSSFINRR